MIRFFVPLLALFLSACHKGPDHIATFQIKTERYTNNGTPFYVVAKPSDTTEFLVDDYRKVADQSLKGATLQDGTQVLFMIPGSTKTLTVKSEEPSKPAIYFLFTNPGEEWKYIVSEEGKVCVKILLGQHEVEAISAFKDL